MQHRRQGSHSQERVVAFFQDALGYVYLGKRRNRNHPNRNVVPERLADWLKDSGYDSAIVAKVLREVEQAAALSGSKTLYEANRAVYSLLRYGVKVRLASPLDSDEVSHPECHTRA